ncbi:MAG TPA: TOBE domain-containing protein [Candidatus Acidoferrales bacterium]|nr:TOBE domain-containing protein [Candidatus Acidoferrales bacterium]
MKISVRNKIPATIKEVKLGAVMAEIVMQAGNNEIVAVITIDAAEDLALKSGDSVTALVKSTSVMIQK